MPLHEAITVSIICHSLQCHSEHTAKQHTGLHVTFQGIFPPWKHHGSPPPFTKESILQIISIRWDPHWQTSSTHGCHKHWAVGALYRGTEKGLGVRASSQPTLSTPHCSLCYKGTTPRGNRLFLTHLSRSDTKNNPSFFPSHTIL